MEEKQNRLSSAERKSIEKQRKNAIKQAQKFRREQAKKLREEKEKSANGDVNEVKSKSKIEEALKSRIDEEQNTESNGVESREEKFRREGKRKIRSLKAKDYDDGYYIDEYGEKKKQERRAREIHEQEQEVIRRPKKPLELKQIERRRIVRGVLVVAVIAIIGIVLCLTVLFKTEKINIENNQYYYDDQIISFSGVEKEQNIIIAALTSTPEKISENLPYIENAEISFSIPDTVNIKITNATPSYAIPHNGGYLIVSGKGRILAEADNNDSNLPILISDELKDTNPGKYVTFTDHNVPEILSNISKAISENKIEGITGIDITNTAQIKLTYQKRITIVLGMPDDLIYKMRTAMAIIEGKLDPNKTGAIAGTLDVSDCNTTKVSRYKPSETTAPPEPTTQPETSGTWSGDTWTDNWTGDSANGDTQTDDSWWSDTGDNGYTDDDYTWNDDNTGNADDTTGITDTDDTTGNFEDNQYADDAFLGNSPDGNITGYTD